MRALAYCTTTSHCCSDLTLTCRAGWQLPNLRHDSDAAVVMTEVLAAVCQPLQRSGHSLCGLPDSFRAVDTAFGAWHGGHSLWTSAVEQRTQPCGALRKWTSALRSGPGADQVPYNCATFTDFDSLLLQAPSSLQDSNDTQDVA